MMHVIGWAALILAGSGGQAQTPPSTPVATRPKTICRNGADTGSRMVRHRVCLTAAEWKERDQGVFDGAYEVQRRSRLDMPK